MKTLTVAVPCYNSQDYMRHAIEPLLICENDIEILIIDDGSKDKTGEIGDLLEGRISCNNQMYTSGKWWTW